MGLCRALYLIKACAAQHWGKSRVEKLDKGVTSLGEPLEGTASSLAQTLTQAMYVVGMQIAELGAENEHLQWRLQSGARRLEAAEQKAEALQLTSMQASTSASTDHQQAQAVLSQQQEELQGLSSQNRQLQDQLRLTEAKLREAHKLQQQQQHQLQAEHARAEQSWDESSRQLQQQLGLITQQNQALLAQQAAMEAQLHAAEDDTRKVQHAQQAAEDMHNRTDAVATQDSRLQGQVERLKKENALQAQHSRKLEGEVRALQQQLHDQMSQQQQSIHSMRAGMQLESPSGAKLAAVQQQAELVAAENASLQLHCKQQAAVLAKSQEDVQVKCQHILLSACHSRHCKTSMAYSLRQQQCLVAEADMQQTAFQVGIVRYQ